VIAGAGIGGLTAALAIAQRGFRVAVLETAERLEEVGAGIQLSPNASRILIGLGLGEHIKPHLVTPDELKVMNGPTARVLARAPLGTAIQERFGAPYWVIHRGDLQIALLAAVRSNPDITLKLGATVDDFAAHDNGITVAARQGTRPTEEHGIALVAADGLWSNLRQRLGHRGEPRFAGHAAWRTLVPAATLPEELSAPKVNLWLGPDAHLVHYPVKGGALVNVVAILRDDWRDPGWTAKAHSHELRVRFPAGMWPTPVHELIRAAAQWHKWALHDFAPLRRWGKGPVTLLGDAAHPMLPYLAQGAAMAIEDAAVLALCLASSPSDPAAAMRAYEDKRRARTARTQRAARRNGLVYHMGGAGALLRTFTLLAMRGSGLIRNYRWLYGWQPD
jgi:salicylate hydroxylase